MSPIIKTEEVFSGGPLFPITATTFASTDDSGEQGLEPRSRSTNKFIHGLVLPLFILTRGALTASIESKYQLLSTPLSR